MVHVKGYYKKVKGKKVWVPAHERKKPSKGAGRKPKSKSKKKR